MKVNVDYTIKDERNIIRKSASYIKEHWAELNSTEFEKVVIKEGCDYNFRLNGFLHGFNVVRTKAVYQNITKDLHGLLYLYFEKDGLPIYVHYFDVYKKEACLVVTLSSNDEDLVSLLSINL